MPDIREQVRAAGLREGFDVVRFARAEAPSGIGANLQEFLNNKRHGTMNWLARNAARRGDPNALWPEARSIIIL